MALILMERKTKEIGIRKVFGASIKSIVLFLTKSFVFVVILAALISCPIAYFFMNKWLQDYVYRSEMNSWDFILPVFIILFVVLILISVKTLKTAKTNPVDSLRNE
jgi:putative ABC transport system permease protein